jgi:hypothetical protein
MSKSEIEDANDLALREWAYFLAKNGGDTLASIKFGEVWAYGKILEYDAYRISADLDRTRLVML